MIRGIVLFLALLFAAPALAQTFPQLTGRVVDQANLLDPGQEAQLTQKLEALEQSTTRQLVVVTVNDLEGLPERDYAYRLGRHWGIGQRDANNGVVLLIAPNQRRMAIEAGYGLEGILTDALASRIIREQITPRFRDNDYPGGINAGVDAIIEQLQAPPEAAEQRALEAAQAESGDGGPSFWPLIFWLGVLGFILVPLFFRGMRGKRYRRRRGRNGPVVIWGPGVGTSSSSSWGGSSWSSGSSWGSGGSSWSGGGGFSGGGGSFGGGGASGGW